MTTLPSDDLVDSSIRREYLDLLAGRVVDHDSTAKGAVELDDIAVQAVVLEPRGTFSLLLSRTVSVVSTAVTCGC